MKIKFFTKLIIISIFLLFSVSQIFAQSLLLDNSSDSRIKFTLSIQSLDIARQGDFTRVSINGEDARFGGIGKPKLPAIRRIIPLPSDNNFSVNIQIIETQRISLSSNSLPNYIMPNQPDLPKNINSKTFIFDNSYYSDSTFSIEPNSSARIKPLGIIRGQRVGILEILPITYYNPRTGEIRYISRANITINYGTKILSDTKASRSKIFSHLLKDVMPVHFDIPPEPDFPIVYWVIYYDDFSDAIFPFIQWKEQMGYDVIATPISEIGATCDDIKNAVQNAYDTWENPPDFVLLVGDVEQIPSNYTGEHYTDLYYYTVDGDDYLPDILYGRFSCATDSQVSAIVEKSIYYEKFQMTDSSFLRRPTFVACGTDGDYELAESTHRYVFTTWLTPPEFEPESLWAFDGATASDVISSVNSGALLMNYSGHGWEGGWGNPSVGISDIYGLTNNGKYPLVISNACLTGKFDTPECFGEAWIRAPQKGAIAFIGGSNSTYWDGDDVWEKRWFDAIFGEGYTSIAGATYKGGLAVNLAIPDEGQYYLEVYQNLGDPSLYLYWGETTPINVDLSDWSGHLPLGEDYYDIPVSVDDALVSLYRDGEQIGSAISSGGIAHIVPEFIPTEPGSAIVVATKPNFYSPFILTVPNDYLSITEYSPESLRVGVDNDFEITILDGDSVGYDSTIVIIFGLGVAETTITNSDGYASMTVNPPYGIPLTLEAYNSGRRILSREIETYGGLAWSLDSISVSTPSIELAGSLAIGFEGDISFALSESGFRCYVFAGSISIDTDFSDDSGTISFTPSDGNFAAVMFAKNGYNVICDTFPIILATGPFDGVVVDTAGVPLTVRPNLTFIDHSGDTISSFRGDWDGSFALPGEIACDTYTVDISAFGYYDTSYTFLLTTRGGYEFALTPTPRSEIMVHIKDIYGNPISAEVQLLTADTRELVGIGNEMEAGNFSLSEQPFCEYSIIARSRGYSPGRMNFTPSGDTTYLNITLEPNDYDILLIDLTGSGYSTTVIRRDLDSLGYTATTTSSFPDTSEMWLYNMIVVSAADESDAATTSRLQTLLDYHRSGGRIIFEGGDLAYQVIAHGGFPPEFAEDLFHLSSYESDVVGDSGLVVTSQGQDSITFYNPNFLSRSYSTVTGLGTPTYFDVIKPDSDSYLLYAKHTDSTSGCISVFPDSEHRGFARSAFFAMDYIDGFTSSTVAPSIFSNLVDFVLPPVTNKGILYGNITLSTGAPGNLTQITATGTETVIDSSYSDGRFVFLAHPGDYSVLFQRVSYRDTTISVRIDAFQPTRIELTLQHTDYVQEIVPDRVLIGNPQPNPFNSTVSVDFINPNGDEIFGKIIDIDGKLVYKFHISRIKSGRFLWHPEKNIGSGMYFVIFNVGELRTIRKILYIK